MTQGQSKLQVDWTSPSQSSQYGGIKYAFYLISLSISVPYEFNEATAWYFCKRYTTKMLQQLSHTHSANTEPQWGPTQGSRPSALPMLTAHAVPGGGSHATQKEVKGTKSDRGGPSGFRQGGFSETVTLKTSVNNRREEKKAQARKNILEREEHKRQGPGVGTAPEPVRLECSVSV